MSNDGLAIALFYGGPPVLVALMFGYGISLVNQKPTPSNPNPSSATEAFGWFLILTSLSIVGFAIWHVVNKMRSK